MPNFQAKTFFLVSAIKSAAKCLMFSNRSFWSVEMVVDRWNLAGFRCGPWNEKVADPCIKGKIWIKFMLSVNPYCIFSFPGLLIIYAVKNRQVFFFACLQC